MNLYLSAAFNGVIAKLFTASAETPLKAGLVQFDATMIMQVINTIILFLALRHFLFKPVTEFMQKRQEGIKKSLDDAAQKNLDAEGLISTYKGKIASASDEADEIMRERIQKAERKATDILKKAAEDANKIKDKALVEIEREKEKAVVELREEISTLAILAASKVIEKDLDDSSHKELINKFIDEVGDSKWQS